MIGKVREAVCHVLAYELDCEFDEIKKLIRDFTARDKWNFCIPVHKFKKPPEEIAKAIDSNKIYGLKQAEVSGKFLNFYYDDNYYGGVIREMSEIRLCVDCKHLGFGESDNNPLNKYNHICMHESFREKILNHITGEDESRYKLIIRNKLNQDGSCTLFEAGDNSVKAEIQRRKNKRPFWKFWSDWSIW